MSFSGVRGTPRPRRRGGHLARRRGAGPTTAGGWLIQGPSRARARAVSLGLGVAVMLGCSAQATAPEPEPTLTQDELMDPRTCESCHSQHYAEWSGSMHAYASDDPVFLAMNRRGQEATQGQLGSFCVQCHAPLAVATGATTDGLNLDDVPSKLKGVNCFFCHTADSVAGSHDFNNPLHLASDGVMRGELADPLPNTAHRAGYSALHDRDKLESSRMCGTCHDVVTGLGAHIERGFAEWKESVFAQPEVGTTCGQCHMDQSKELRQAATVPSAPPRRTHSHMFPAVDTALTPFPEADAQAAAVKDLLDSTLQSALCRRGVGEQSQIVVVLDNVASGHGFPSGAAQDRRLWPEITAYAGDAVVYQSGVVPEGAPIAHLIDPDLWLMRDCMFDVGGTPVDMFWQAAGHDTKQLPAQLTFDQTDIRYYRTHIFKTYPVGDALPSFDRVKLRMRLEPIGRDVIRDLVTSGHLDPVITPPVLTVGRELEWTAASATEKYIDKGIPMSCISNTNLSAAADRVPAKTTCTAPAGGDDPSVASGTDGGTEQVSCVGDARVDHYAANLHKVSAQGTRVTLTAAEPGPPVKGINAWTLSIADANQVPVENAVVTVTPFMPDHGHGTSVKPVVTAQGGGLYNASPVYLFMPGVWRVGVSVNLGGATEVVNFYFCIEG